MSAHAAKPAAAAAPEVTSPSGATATAAAIVAATPLPSTTTGTAAAGVSGAEHGTMPAAGGAGAGTGAGTATATDADADADEVIELPPAEGPLVRCLQAYATFKREQGVVDGAYYLVVNGHVLDEPLAGMEEAQDLLVTVESWGAKVDWGAVLLVEAGNERGLRNPTARYARIATTAGLLVAVAA